MSIQEHLNKIRNAVYGSEVRESIAKGIETAYDDASENDNANMEVKLARGTNPNLNTRLNIMDEADRQNAGKIDSNYQEVNDKIEDNHNEVTAQLAQKVGGGKLADMGDLSQEVKEAMTGGSVAVVGEGAVTNQNLANDVNERFDKVAEETNILKKYGTIDGKRVNAEGFPLDDTGFFRTNLFRVQSGDRYASSSLNVGSPPTFAFYNGNEITRDNFVQALAEHEVVVPSGATHMLVWTYLSLKDSMIIKRMDEGFPNEGEETFVYKDVYKKTETYSKGHIDVIEANQIIHKNQLHTIGFETNLIRSNKIIENSRVRFDGSLYEDEDFFRTEPIPVSEGERYANVPGLAHALPTISFYSSEVIKPENLVSQEVLRSVTVPSDAKYMIIQSLKTTREGLIVKQMDEGFPTLGEDTYVYNQVYTKSEVDSLVNAPKWYPDVWELEIIDDERPHRVACIDSEDTLYLSEPYNGIYKANNVDLSDIRMVAKLPSHTSLTKLVLVTDEKAVGYVQSGPDNKEDEGFYVFENIHTDEWTYRKTGQMIAGYPALEFQSLIKTPDSEYLFAISYSSAEGKITDLDDTTTEAARHVYRSTDLGESWEIVYTHLSRFNTHMHAIEWDVYRDRLWVAIGDEGAGGRPGWAWSDDYGETFDFVENDDSTGQPPFMDTNIIPTRKYVLFGSDHMPAGIRKWEPKVDEKHAHVSNEDVTTLYSIPYPSTDNFGFARSPVVDTSSYPYKIGMSFTHNADYSGSVILLSPNFRDWYEFDYVADPQTTPSWNQFSGITSDGWVLGYSHLTNDGRRYYRRFKFPNWIKN